MSRLVLLAMAMLAAAVPACGPLDGPVGIPNTCVVGADNPHASHHANKRINAIVWIKCGEPMSSATVHVRLEKKAGTTWISASDDSKSIAPLRANRKESHNVDIFCEDGVYRTVGYAEVAGDHGTGKSRDYHSREVTIRLDEKDRCIDGL